MEVFQTREVTPDTVSGDPLDLTPCSPDDDDGNCQYPRSGTVLDMPEFDSTLSISQLHKRLIQHYSSSAFNRCTRQTLPLMRVDPLPIPVKTGVRPSAVHTPLQ